MMLQPQHPFLRHLLIGFEHPFAIELSRGLQLRYGPDQVEGTNDIGALPGYLERWRPTDVYLLTSPFAPPGAEHPATQWHHNTRQLLKVLGLARRYGFRLFYPGSIAVFGPSAPATSCDDHAPQEPQSYFGLSKRAAERWCEHYFLEYDVDVRSLRFPVIIRPATDKRSQPIKEQSQSSPEKLLSPLPLTGFPTNPRTASTAATAATDFYLKPPLTRTPTASATAAITQARPVLHLLDAVRATVELMSAPSTAIRNRRGYNLAGTSLSLSDLATELQHEASYRGIECWNLPEDPGPTSLDCSAARADWGWNPTYDLVRLIGSFLSSR